MTLVGKVVLITGAGSGIGRGLALAMGQEGASVLVAAYRRAAGDAVVDEITRRGGRALCVACDVTRRGAVEAAVDAAVATFGGLDAFVHNAVSQRSSEPMELERAPVEVWDEHAAVSITALHHCACAAFAHLCAAKGTLLVLTSPAGVQGSDRLSFYATVKGAQRGFVKALAREWGPHGVRVNGLAPLAVTPALENAFRRDPGMEPRLSAVIPLRRLGDPETDIGPAAAFLCSDAARYVTGQTLVVSGGRFTAL